MDQKRNLEVLINNERASIRKIELELKELSGQNNLTPEEFQAKLQAQSSYLESLVANASEKLTEASQLGDDPRLDGLKKEVKEIDAKVEDDIFDVEMEFHAKIEKEKEQLRILQQKF